MRLILKYHATFVQGILIQQRYDLHKHHMTGKLEILTTQAGKYKGLYTDYQPHADEAHMITQLQRLMVSQLPAHYSPKVTSEPCPQEPTRAFFTVTISMPTQFGLDGSNIVMAAARAPKPEPAPQPVWRQNELTESAANFEEVSHAA